MKAHLALTTAALLTAGNAHAFTTEDCKAMGELAFHVMTVRQLEAPLNETMTEALKDQTIPEAIEIIKQVILEAYKRPAMVTDEFREMEVARFRNDVELDCFNNLSE